MKHLAYIIAALLTLTWAIGYFAMQAGENMHIILGLAMVLIIHQLVITKKAPLHPKGHTLGRKRQRHY